MRIQFLKKLSLKPTDEQAVVLEKQKALLMQENLKKFYYMV